MCKLCKQEIAIHRALFCDTCHEVTKRLGKFLRSSDAREFTYYMIKEAQQVAEFERRAFPTTQEDHYA